MPTAEEIKRHLGITTVPWNRPPQPIPTTTPTSVSPPTVHDLLSPGTPEEKLDQFQEFVDDRKRTEEEKTFKGKPVVMPYHVWKAKYGGNLLDYKRYVTSTLRGIKTDFEELKEDIPEPKVPMEDYPEKEVIPEMIQHDIPVAPTYHDINKQLNDAGYTEENWKHYQKEGITLKDGTVIGAGVARRQMLIDALLSYERKKIDEYRAEVSEYEREYKRGVQDYHETYAREKEDYRTGYIEDYNKFTTSQALIASIKKSKGITYGSADYVGMPPELLYIMENSPPEVASQLEQDFRRELKAPAKVVGFVGPTQQSSFDKAYENAFKDLPINRQAQFNIKYLDWSKVTPEEMTQIPGGTWWFAQQSSEEQDRIVNKLVNSKKFQKYIKSQEGNSFIEALLLSKEEEGKEKVYGGTPIPFFEESGTALWRKIIPESQKDIESVSPELARFMLLSGQENWKKELYDSLPQKVQSGIANIKAAASGYVSMITFPEFLAEEGLGRVISGVQEGTILSKHFFEQKPQQALFLGKDDPLSREHLGGEVEKEFAVSYVPPVLSAGMMEGYSQLTGGGGTEAWKIVKDYPLVSFAGGLGEVAGMYYGGKTTGLAWKGAKYVTPRAVSPVVSGTKKFVMLTYPKISSLSKYLPATPIPGKILSKFQPGLNKWIKTTTTPKTISATLGKLRPGPYLSRLKTKLTAQKSIDIISKAVKKGGQYTTEPRGFTSVLEKTKAIQKRFSTTKTPLLHGTSGTPTILKRVTPVMKSPDLTSFYGKILKEKYPSWLPKRKGWPKEFISGVGKRTGAGGKDVLAMHWSIWGEASEWPLDLGIKSYKYTFFKRKPTPSYIGTVVGKVKAFSNYWGKRSLTQYQQMLYSRKPSVTAYPTHKILGAGAGAEHELQTLFSMGLKKFPFLFEQQIPAMKHLFKTTTATSPLSKMFQNIWGKWGEVYSKVTGIRGYTKVSTGQMVPIRPYKMTIPPSLGKSSSFFEKLSKEITIKKAGRILKETSEYKAGIGYRPLIHEANIPYYVAPFREDIRQSYSPYKPSFSYSYKPPYKSDYKKVYDARYQSYKQPSYPSYKTPSYVYPSIAEPSYYSPYEPSYTPPPYKTERYYGGYYPYAVKPAKHPPGYLSKKKKKKKEEEMKLTLMDEIYGVRTWKVKKFEFKKSQWKTPTKSQKPSKKTKGYNLSIKPPRSKK